MVGHRNPSDLAVMTFELLQRIQAQLDDMLADLRDLKVRMSAPETTGRASRSPLLTAAWTASTNASPELWAASNAAST